ncbi:MAG: glycoside hydrolase family 13 protein [Clostridiaceae bacterium]|nr:glycoside hydrolase family 13 protein [Clostridiaceae bacterium]
MSPEQFPGNLSATHDSRSQLFRSPFGARKTWDKVRLYFEISRHFDRVMLCYTYGLYKFSYHEMPMVSIDNGDSRYFVDLTMPGEAGIIFYWFSFYDVDPNTGLPKEVYYYVKPGSDRSGKGRLSRVPSRVGVEEERFPGAFQITVYDKSFKTPDWFKGAMIYQIFPDRFFRGRSFDYEHMKSLNASEDRIYHEDWTEDVDIDGKPETGYVACDFYGGNLQGIAEQMDYIRSLNIDLIYLNPIFEARSNHRYDTADYLSVDPLLGGQPGYEALRDATEAAGIRFILDGVFSHTGADSVYFNKYGRYPGIGAYQAYVNGEHSPYQSWYNFSRDSKGTISYDSWWGFPELPNVNENDLFYKGYILGNDGVLAHWMKNGSSGFRLDVSDELPDGFIREIRKRIKQDSDGEGVIVGEVWEDASNKISYGSYRDFLLGNSHDSVMGYTFRDALIGYLVGTYSARDANHLLETYRENYPPEAHYCIMNLISSHDVPRAITCLAGSSDPGDRHTQKQIFLSPEQKRRGLALMRLGYVFQLSYVGSPCLYYGDEVGMEGYRDPFNRRTYPWGQLSDEERAQLEFFRNFSNFRKANPVLKTGFYRTLIATDYLFVFERTLSEDNIDFFGRRQNGPRRIVVAFNSGVTDICNFELEPSFSNAIERTAPDILSEGESIKNINGSLRIALNPLEYVVYIEN